MGRYKYKSRAAYQAEYRERHPDRVRASRLMYWFSLSVEEYDRMLDEQGGVCAICGQSESMGYRDLPAKALAVDHDHACCAGRKSCGKCVRGLLCARCNHVLAVLGDRIDLLEQMIEYIDTFRRFT